MQEKQVTELQTTLRQCRSSFAAIGLFSFFINLLMLSGPLYMMQVYDRVLTSQSVSTLVALSVLVGILLLFMGALELVRARVLVRIGNRIEARLGARIFDTVIRRQTCRRDGGTTQPLFDLRTVREFLSGQGPFAIFDTPWVPVYLAVIYLLHPILFVVSLAGALILLVIGVLNEVTTRRPLTDATYDYSKCETLADAGLRNAEAVQAMGMLDGLRQQWIIWRDRALHGQSLASDRAGAFTSASKTMRLALQSAILGVGAALAIDQAISAGAMIAASIIMGRALAPVDQAIGNWRNFVSTHGAYKRLSGLLTDFPLPPTRMALPKAQGPLVVQNVAAGPPEATRAIVSGIDFDLEAGEALGVIGPSASGKSLLARLLTGVWHPQIGTVRLDGASLDQWDPTSLGRQTGYLPQDVELFGGSVEENIARFRPDADPEAVVHAARAAGVHEMILRLPEGYNTQIGDGGCRLSGGQRQRLGLARALYGDPLLVVLDEPNANLDADGDAALTQAILKIKKRGGIAVVMAHRPSAIDAVDKLLVIQAGRQQAFGPKDEILNHTQNGTPAITANVSQLPRRNVS